MIRIKSRIAPGKPVTYELVEETVALVAVGLTRENAIRIADLLNCQAVPPRMRRRMTYRSSEPPLPTSRQRINRNAIAQGTAVPLIPNRQQTPIFGIRSKRIYRRMI